MKPPPKQKAAAGLTGVGKASGAGPRAPAMTCGCGGKEVSPEQFAAHVQQRKLGLRDLDGAFCHFG
eukprot:10957076-Alexandrium_andersonii.AAC.3